MATRVEELDLLKSELPANPTYDEFIAENTRQRTHNWLVKNSLGYGIVTYEDAVAFLRNPSLHQAGNFSSPNFKGKASAFDENGEYNGLGFYDGEEHHRLKRLMSPTFSAKSIDNLRPQMSQHIQDVVEKVHSSIDSVSFEFQEAFKPYPLSMICILLDIPSFNWDLFNRWVDAIPLRWLSSVEEQEYLDTTSDFLAYLRELIEDRKMNLGDDLLSSLIKTEDDGDKLSTNELIGLVLALSYAGVATMRNQLGMLIAQVAERPDLLQTLKKDPSLIRDTVEESLRFQNTLRIQSRIVVEEFEYKDVIFSPGQIITISSASANHDETKFANPDDFDIFRDSVANHLSLGSGVHYCLGAFLARAELQEALKVFINNWSSISIDGEIEWMHLRSPTWGPVSIPLHVVRDSSFIHQLWYT